MPRRATTSAAMIHIRIRATPMTGSIVTARDAPARLRQPETTTFAVWASPTTPR